MKTAWKVKKGELGIDCPAFEVKIEFTEREYEIVERNITTTWIAFDEPIFCPGGDGSCHKLSLTKLNREQIQPECRDNNDIKIVRDDSKRALMFTTRLKFRSDVNYEELGGQIARKLHQLVEDVLQRLISFETFEHSGTIEMSDHLKQKLAVFTFVSTANNEQGGVT